MADKLASSGSGASREEEGVRQGEVPLRASDSQNFAFTWMDTTLGIVQGRIICSSGEFKSDQQLLEWLAIESTMLKGILEKMLLTIDALVPLLVSRDTPNEATTPKEAKRP